MALPLIAIGSVPSSHILVSPTRRKNRRMSHHGTQEPGEGFTPKRGHDINTPQEAVHLVSEHVGVAILTKPTALGFRAEGVVVRPLSDASLRFQTCVIMRKDDDSRLTNEFVRSFLRRYADQRRPPKPIGSPVSARVVAMKKANPPARS